MLMAATLRHIAGTRSGARGYLDTDCLNEQEKHEAQEELLAATDQVTKTSRLLPHGGADNLRTRLQAPPKTKERIIAGHYRIGRNSICVIVSSGFAAPVQRLVSDFTSFDTNLLSEPK
jgi:hypothetical protein